MGCVYGGGAEEGSCKLHAAEVGRDNDADAAAKSLFKTWALVVIQMHLGMRRWYKCSFKSICMCVSTNAGLLVLLMQS